MSDESKDEKARKLAAARKKLKEYQRRGAEGHSNGNVDTNTIANTNPEVSVPNHDDTHTGTSVSQEVKNEENPVSGQTSTQSISSNTFEADTEACVIVEDAVSSAIPNPNNNNDEESTTALLPKPANPSTDEQERETETIPVLSSYFEATVPMPASIADVLNARKHNFHNVGDENGSSMEFNHNAADVMDMIIKEKAIAIENMNKYQEALVEKENELHELQLLVVSRTKGFEDLQNLHKIQQKQMEELCNKNDALEAALVKLKADSVDQARHLDELKHELGKVSSNNVKLQQQYQEKCKELEMVQIRIQQLSNESSPTKEVPSEAVSQREFIHVQQIRDLQAMVQHLTQEKDQANLQYQNYVQHLNVEVNKLNEKNSELSEECNRLQDRERQLVDHISGLEREIQKSISLREEFKNKEQTQNTLENTAELGKLKEKIADFDLERHEFQLKIKSQEDRLEKMITEVNEKQSEMEILQQRLEELSMQQPDTTKLLATMESDKVAASRALTQNVELKKQLDELELRFVQLTNDKADLMNKLDAEEYANREMRSNYSAMEQKLNDVEKRFEFKDEEMIRLSHENVELMQKYTEVQQKLQLYMKSQSRENIIKNDNNNDEHNHQEHQHNHAEGVDVHDSHHHDHHHDHQHEHHHHDHHDRPNDYYNQGDGHDHDHDHHYHPHHKHIDYKDKDSPVTDTEIPMSMETAEEAIENDYQVNKLKTQPQIPTEEAVEKLQQRFTQLMTQVADLTDERQRLEHLVMQLQGETETIGEYITLYQTQRRMLKQREYEKAAQMKLLQMEREQLHEKIALLNNLVISLGVELPPEGDITTSSTQIRKADNICINEVSESESPITNGNKSMSEIKINPTVATVTLNSPESKEILSKIHDILTEIKEDTRDVPTVTHTVDQLNCCLGKFETV